VKVERRRREVKRSESEGRTITFYYPTRLVVRGRNPTGDFRKDNSSVELSQAIVALGLCKLGKGSVIKSGR